MIINAGITIGGGINIVNDNYFPVTSATLIYDLDAANFGSVPTNGVSKDATGTYTLTVANGTGSIAYSSANGGYFSKLNNVGTDYIIGGPNYTSTSQSYTVFMAYDVNTTSGGRLLNTNNESTNDWLMGSYYSGSYYKNVWYPNASLNLSVDAYTVDSGWNFIWGSYNASTGVANLYVATNTMPAAVYKTATYVAGSARGFNQLRMWSRASASETQTGNIGFVKVYNGVLSLTDVQNTWKTYRSRFGY